MDAGRAQRDLRRRVREGRRREERRGEERRGEEERGEERGGEGRRGKERGGEKRRGEERGGEGREGGEGGEGEGERGKGGEGGLARRRRAHSLVKDDHVISYQKGRYETHALGAQCNRCSGCRRAEGAVGDARCDTAADSALRRWHTPS